MEAYVSDDATPTNPYDPPVNGAETDAPGSVLVDESPTDPGGPPPWPAHVPGARTARGNGGTVVVRSAQTGSGRNTSTIAQAEDIQGILAKVQPAVVAITAESSFGTGAGTGFGPRSSAARRTTTSQSSRSTRPGSRPRSSAAPTPCRWATR
jgi:hypothetical protein